MQTYSKFAILCKYKIYLQLFMLQNKYCDVFTILICTNINKELQTYSKFAILCNDKILLHEYEHSNANVIQVWKNFANINCNCNSNFMNSNKVLQTYSEFAILWN